MLSALAAATPSPSPSGPDPTSVTPGAWGFAAILLVAVFVVFLVWDMMRRIRRGRYRAQVQEELDAEQASQAGDEPRD
jgi:flagellar biosynthesis/type III secretory pathway M-ring protein FliF/YscJ